MLLPIDSQVVGWLLEHTLPTLTLPAPPCRRCSCCQAPARTWQEALLVPVALGRAIRCLPLSCTCLRLQCHHNLTPPRLVPCRGSGGLPANPPGRSSACDVGRNPHGRPPGSQRASGGMPWHSIFCHGITTSCPLGPRASCTVRTRTHPAVSSGYTRACRSALIPLLTLACRHWPWHRSDLGVCGAACAPAPSMLMPMSSRSSPGNPAGACPLGNTRSFALPSLQIGMC
jgi:hypothetical protein